MHDQRFTHSWFKIFLLSRFFHTCALVGERIDDCINNEEDTRSVYHHEARDLMKLLSRSVPAPQVGWFLQLVMKFLQSSILLGSLLY